MLKTTLSLAFSIVFAGSALAQSAHTAVPAVKSIPKSEAPNGVAAVSRSPLPSFDEGTYQRISNAMLSYSAIQVRGGWPALPKDAKLAPGSTGPDVALLRQRLAITDDLDPAKIQGDSYDDAVVAAVRRFQARHGLADTGTVGPQTLTALNVPVAKRLRQLSASLDRLAELNFTFGQRYVVVNIPAAVAEAVNGNTVEHRYVVVVGKIDRPSPTLTTNITTVNLNPTWTVPLSILKKDIVTKMRKDPNYLARMKMKALDGQGNEIDPKTIDWSSDRSPNFTVRQDSGDSNALGNLRIDMPNPYSVYMHDTNHRNLFSADYRFQSSGCTRVAEVRDLAVWLLQDNNPAWTRAALDAGIAKGQRTDVRLAHKVPVAWVYMTGWVTRDDVVHFRDDIYHHDEHTSRPLTAEVTRPPIVTAARASGFVMQSYEEPKAPSITQISYLDSR